MNMNDRRFLGRWICCLGVNGSSVLLKDGYVQNPINQNLNGHICIKQLFQQEV